MSVPGPLGPDAPGTGADGDVGRVGGVTGLDDVRGVDEIDDIGRVDEIDDVDAAGGSPAPRRVRVTSPRHGAADRPVARPRAHEIDEETALGEVYLAALLRSQRRLALLVLGPTVLATLALLALVLATTAGDDGGVSVGLDWVLVGVVGYPLMGLGAFLYARAADRVEDEFVELLRRR